MKRTSVLRHGALLLVSCFVATTLRAQINRGVIEGLASDPAGAVVPGVQVAVTSLATNVQVSTQTDGAGYYRVVNLIPGKYTCRFTASGFTPLEVTNIEATAGTVTRVDAQLKVGATHQTVEVSAAAALVQTSATNFSTTLGTRVIDELPLAGRDIQQLVYQVPGMNPVTGPPGSNFGFNSDFGTFPDPSNINGSNISMNGGQASANAWYLDGNLDTSSFAENMVVNPSPDTVEEFQAIDNAFAAEHGRTGGGLFNIVLKSGTNALHGNVYEFLRNSNTNARNPFTSIDSLGNLIPSRVLHYNNFGGTLGGPVILPKIYNGKDKTFFFFSWDARDLHLEDQRTTLTVPTPLMRAGDFSEDPNTAQFGLWDPLSTTGPATDGTFARTAFGTPITPNGCTGQIIPDPANPGGTTTFIPSSSTCNFAAGIPANRMSQTAMFFINAFPMPNFNDPLATCPLAAGGQYKVCNNFRGTVATAQVLQNISIKIDHHWSPRSTYFFEWLDNPGKYTNYKVPITGPDYYWYAGFGSSLPLNVHNQIFGLGNTYTIGPTFINEFRYNFSRQLLDARTRIKSYQDQVAGLGQVLPLLAPIKIPTTPTYPVPNFNISTPAGGYLTFGNEQWEVGKMVSESHNLLDNVTKIVGKHTLKTGFQYRLDHNAWVNDIPTVLYFYGSTAANPVTGLSGGAGLTQFEEGLVTSGFTGNYISPYMMWRYWGAYFQDDYHVTPRLNVHLGLRWDFYGWPGIRSWRPMSNFCLNCANSLTGLPGKVVYEGDPEFSKRKYMYPGIKDDFQPRIDFAWTPSADRKTVIRGGYNIFYSPVTDINNYSSQFALPGWLQMSSWPYSIDPSQCPSFSGPCVNWSLDDKTTDKASLLFPSLALGALKRDPLAQGFSSFEVKQTHDPMVQEWGLQIQRQLPSDVMVSVGYVGSHGTHTYGEPFRSYSYVHTRDVIKYKASINDVVPITNFYSGQTAAELQKFYGSPDLSQSILLRTYPFWSSLTALAIYDGTNVYHGMNLRIEKKYSHGLDFNIAYTLSKNMTNSQSADLGSLLVDPIHTFANPGGRGNFTRFYNTRYQDPDNRKDHMLSVEDIPQILNLTVAYELPVGKGKAFVNRGGPVNGILGGWKLVGNFNAESGIPLSVFCPGDQLTSRCDLIGDPHFKGHRTRQQQIAQWINPDAFLPPFGGDQNFWANYDPNDPRAYRFGTAGFVLPNLRSPGSSGLDTTLMKKFSLTESKYFEFRWEMFNALNHMNLSIPSTSFCLPPKPDGTTDLVHQSGCSFGRISNIATDPRAMEFALKFYF